MEMFKGCPLLNANLQDIKANIRYRDWDWFDVDTGMEGAGKSSLGLYKCSVVDDAFDPVKQTIYSQMQFSNALDRLDPGQALYVDEGVTWLFNRNWNSPESRLIVADLMVCRELNLYICVNITNIRYLDVYVREDRLRSMMNILTYDSMGQDGHAYRERGLFECYSRATILDHFNPELNRPMIPEFIEPYPRIQDLAGGVEMWDLYHKGKAEFLKNRKKVREDTKRWQNQKVNEDAEKTKIGEKERERIAAVANWVGQNASPLLHE